MDSSAIARNLVIYAIGLALSISGALGLARAIELDLLLAGALFVAGLGMVVAVHEWLDGPF